MPANYLPACWPGDAERPTMPPGPPDPVMAICMRIEENTDALKRSVDSLFLLMQEEKKARKALSKRVTFLEKAHRSRLNGGTDHGAPRG